MISRFSKAEKIFLLSATVTAVCSAAYLFAPSDQITRFEDQSKSLGFIKPQGHDVRIRTESETDWNQVDRDINIYTNDRLFTGSSSTAVVNIKNKQKFKSKNFKCNFSSSFPGRAGSLGPSPGLNPYVT